MRRKLYGKQWGFRQGASERKGFTLIELLIVLAIICLCINFALPYYTQYIIRIRRSEAQTKLLELAQQMESYYRQHHTYKSATLGTGSPTDIQNTDTTPSGWYRLSLSQQTTTHYRIQATPTEQQAAQDLACQSFTIDQSGEKTITEGPSGTPSATASECWNF